MTNERCVQVLRDLIARGDRDEIAAAQAAIIEFAMAQPDAARAGATEDLRRTLAGSVDGSLSDPMQQAFYAVVDAMIERTREAVPTASSGAA